MLGAPQSSLRRLVQRLSVDPAIATLLRSDGRPAPQVKIGPAEIYDLLFAADFNLYVYEQLPSTIDAALRGDDAPLVRLLAVLTGETGSSRLRCAAERRARPARRSAERRRTLRAKRPRPRPCASRSAPARAINEFSNTLNVTTDCEDFTAPWPRGSALGSRQTAIDTAAAAIPDRRLPAVRPRHSQEQLAADRSAAAGPSRPTRPCFRPARCPTCRCWRSTARSTCARRSHGPTRRSRPLRARQVVPVPHTGHSTIGTDVSGCALSLAKRFLIYGGTDGACKNNPLRVPVAGRAVSLDAQPQGAARRLQRGCAAAAAPRRARSSPPATSRCTTRSTSLPSAACSKAPASTAAAGS